MDLKSQPASSKHKLLQQTQVQPHYFPVPFVISHYPPLYLLPCFLIRTFSLLSSSLNIKYKNLHNMSLLDDVAIKYISLVGNMEGESIFK